jgi:hypothetical protein
MQTAGKDLSWKSRNPNSTNRTPTYATPHISRLTAEIRAIFALTNSNQSGLSVSFFWTVLAYLAYLAIPEFRRLQTAA